MYHLCIWNPRERVQSATKTGSQGFVHYSTAAKAFRGFGGPGSGSWGLQDCKDPKSIPEGSKYPILKDSGPKSHLGYGFWDQSPSILGTWTLWVCKPMSFSAMFRGFGQSVCMLLGSRQRPGFGREGPGALRY